VKPQSTIPYGGLGGTPIHSTSWSNEINMYPYLVKGYIYLVHMPGKLSKEWFITISPRTEDEVDLEAVHQKVTASHEHHWVREEGLNGDHPHYHIYLKHEEARRSDVVKKSWSKCYDEKGDMPHNWLVVIPVTDKDRLIGGYLNKADSKVMSTTFTEEQLKGLRDVHKVVAAKQGKRVKRKCLTNLNCVPVMEEYREVMNQSHNKWDRELFTQVVQKVCQAGYSMMSISSRFKWLLKELQAREGETVEWFDQQF